jgi:CubicO group peptidase (beta-lactamase class C family)
LGDVRNVVVPALLSVVVLLPSGCSSDPRPEKTPDRTVSGSALLAAISHDLELIDGRENIAAVVVLVHGKRVLEWYDDVPSARHWDIGWETAAVVATLVGVAIDEGRISGLDATLRQLLPDHVGDMSPSVAATTLRQVLTMTAGFHSTIRDPVAKYVTARDPIAEILRAAQPTPERSIVFSSEGGHLLSAILAKATGQSVLDYARSRLFDPLGIDTSNAYQGPADAENMEAYQAADFAWPVDSTGLNLGWNSLKLTPDDLAKVGQLYLDDGRWKGEQLVSSSWIRQSTGAQAQNLSTTNNDFGGYAYGYGWWLTDADGSPAYFVADESGQLLEVAPDHDLVVAVASQPDYENGGTGVAPDALIFMVDNVIAPQVRPAGFKPAHPIP